jgi:NAD-dependent aldehyde dehydrogenases
VLASLRRRLATLRLGDPLDKNTDVGAINSAAQLAKIRELSESARRRARSAGRRRASCR